MPDKTWVIVRLGKLSVFGVSLAIALRGVATYAPFTEGWWHVYVRWLNQGKVPYKDFELLVPPGYPLLLRSVTNVFGETFLTLRILGAIQIALLGVCIFALTSRFAGQALAVVFSAAAVSHLVSSTAFISYDYVYTALLLMLASFSQVLGLLVSSSDYQQVRWRSWIIAGFFIGLALSVKQTQGLWTFLGATVLMLALRRRDAQGLIKRLALLGVGIAVVWIPLTLWLVAGGVTPADLVRFLYLDGGPKGSATTVFFDWAREIFKLDELPLMRPVLAHWLAMFQSLLPYLSVAAIVKELSSKIAEDKIVERALLAGIFMAGFALWSYQPSRFGSLTTVLDFLWNLGFRYADNRIIFWTALPFFLIWLFFNKPPKPIFEHALGLSVCAFAVVWACGMSGAVSEIGDFLAIAVALSFVTFMGRRRWLAIVLAGLMALSIVSGSWWKNDGLPQYQWWRYETPIPSDATVSYEQGLMSGLKTTPKIRETYEEYRRYLTVSSDCPGEIVAFPHIPLFLLDVDSTPQGRLGQYWYDFSSVDEVTLEIQRLKSRDLKAIILMRLPTDVRENHEQWYNEGRPLPHRALEIILLEKSRGMRQIVSSEISSDVILNVSVSDCVAETIAETDG